MAHTHLRRSPLHLALFAYALSCGGRTPLREPLCGPASDAGDGGDGGGCVRWADEGSGLAGGSVTSVRFDPRTPGVAYALVGPVLYRSTDSGRSFQRWAYGPGAFSELVFPPDAPSRLLAATGNGLHESSDDGRTWRSRALQGLALRSLGLNPLRPQALVASVTGTGILRSSDGGLSWQFTLGTPTPWSAAGFAFDRQNADDLLVAAVQVDSAGSATAMGTVLRPSDAQNWAGNSGVSAATYRVVGCGTSGVFFAASEQGLLRTSDHGATWTLNSTPGSLQSVSAAADCRTVYALTRGTSLWTSQDGGASLTRVYNALTLGSAVEVEADPADSRRALLSTHDGVLLTADGGATFTQVPAINEISTTSLVNNTSGDAFLSTWGTGLWRRSGTGDWTRVPDSTLAATFFFSFQVDPNNGQRLVANTWPTTYFSFDGGRSFSPSTMGSNARSAAFDPTNPQVVYLATQLNGVLKSTDGGRSFAPSNGGLTAWPSDGGTLIDTFAVAVDPSNPQRLLLSTNHSGFYASDNAGGAWARVGADYATDSPSLSLRVPSSSGSETLLFFTATHGILATPDFGRSFRTANEGLADFNFLGAARDPNSGTLYVSVRSGLFRSTDALRWEPFDPGCSPPRGMGPLSVRTQGTRSTLLMTSGSTVFAHPL